MPKYIKQAKNDTITSAGSCELTKKANERLNFLQKFKDLSKSWRRQTTVIKLALSKRAENVATAT